MSKKSPARSAEDLLKVQFNFEKRELHQLLIQKLSLSPDVQALAVLQVVHPHVVGMIAWVIVVRWPAVHGSDPAVPDITVGIG